MTDKELAREIWTEIRRDHQEPVLRFSLERGEPGFLESKVGGTPYLPREMVWPLDGGGKAMGLLAQIDCRELAGLPDFPQEGLLQFYIAYNDVYGLDFDDMTAPGGFRVLYHGTVDPTVTPEDVQAKRPPLPEGDDWLYNTPLGREPSAIRFAAPGVQGMTQGDYQFDALFVEKWNQRRPEDPIENTWDISGDFSSLYSEMEPEQGPFHQLGGYPYFTQTDPRWGGKYPDLDVLLFQLDSEARETREDPDLVMWGDCGVGNFFISREALRRRDFSRVGYNWDCC